MVEHRHHQWFTPGLEHPKLKVHLAIEIALMKISQNWPTFKRHLERALPVQKKQPRLVKIQAHQFHTLPRFSPCP